MSLSYLHDRANNGSHQTVASIGRQHREGVLIWLHLARIFQRLEQSHRDLLTNYDLTPAQFDVLSHLASQPGLHQQELADRLLVTKGNVCGLIDRLEEADLVERRPDPQDRRANTLHLTKEGQSRFAQAAPALEQEIGRHFNRLAPDQIQQLRRILGQLDRFLRS